MQIFFILQRRAAKCKPPEKIFSFLPTRRRPRSRPPRPPANGRKKGAFRCPSAVKKIKYLCGILTFSPPRVTLRSQARNRCHPGVPLFLPIVSPLTIPCPGGRIWVEKRNRPEHPGAFCTIHPKSSGLCEKSFFVAAPSLMARRRLLCPRRNSRRSQICIHKYTQNTALRGGKVEHYGKENRQHPQEGRLPYAR